jgi:ParB family chromosome partitioning protein
MSKLALGRGLKALIPDIQTTEQVRQDRHKNLYDFKEGETPAAPRTAEVGTIASIPISKIIPNPFQPRTEFSRDALDELKQSIIEKGVIQPIAVRRKGTGYELISGERRLRASTEAGFDTIPAYVMDVKTDREMLELALIENIQREKLNPIEVAIGYQRLIDECGLTQEDVALKVGKDRTTVTNFLRLMKLPTEIQNSLKTGELTMGHARALINVNDVGSQLMIWDKIVKQHISVRQVESLAKQAASKPAEKKASPAAKSETTSEKTLDITNVEEKLRSTLATKVKVNHTAKGGEIVIQYYSNDDLERLLELFTNPQ